MNSSPQNTSSTGTQRRAGVDNSDEEEWSGVVECVITSTPRNISRFSAVAFSSRPPPRASGRSVVARTTDVSSTDRTFTFLFSPDNYL